MERGNAHNNNNMYRVAIIIVNYKSPYLTIACIQSLADQVDQQRDCVIIVDNNSGKEDLNIIEQEIGMSGLSGFFKLIKLTENGGFSAGNNAGISSVSAQYYLLTNSDTIFQPSAIPELLSGADKNRDAAIIGPGLEWPNGERQVSCFRYISPVAELINTASIKYITTFFRKYNVPLTPDENPVRPDWISFASVLIRKEVFDKVGMMDESYFMYYEDVDYCRRARMLGFDILCWPEARVVHFHGQSSKVEEYKREKKRLPEYFYKSRSRYYRTYYGSVGLILANILWYTGRAISAFREFITGTERGVPQYQYKDIWIKEKRD